MAAVAGAISEQVGRELLGVTRQVIVALVLGVYCGALIVTGHPGSAFLRVGDTYLVGALAEGREFTDIPGVYTRESIRRFRDAPARDSRFLTHVMVPPAYIEDVDSLPFPARRHVRLRCNRRGRAGTSSSCRTASCAAARVPPWSP